MSLRSTMVVSAPAHGFGGGSSAVPLAVRSASSHDLWFREHRTADRLPGRCAVALAVRYQSDIILIAGRMADTTADRRHPDARTQ